MFPILLEALSGTIRLTDFRSALGVARHVLGNRLAALMDAGVLEKRPYREAGANARGPECFLPTSSGLRGIWIKPPLCRA